MSMKPKILIVDDEPYTITLIEKLLARQNVDLKFARDCAQARQSFRENDFNLILMDQRLPDGFGLDLLQEMRAERPNQVAIMITAYANVRDAMRTVQEGLFDYLTKPFENLEEIEGVIAKALEMDRAYREIRSLREALDGQTGPVLIGRSRPMENLLTQIKQVAPLDTTILLEAESGTGKEVVARTVHTHSPWADGPFQEVNCGALSESLQESTLFGYEKGAFTGAVKTTPGCLEAADGGTLLLDEIADMSPKTQANLLRVLQERTFTRLGSTKVHETHFRLICATNKRLIDEVKAGRFREDLFYRINVVTLAIPPLRQRRDDILPLATHFLDHFNRKFGKSVGPLSPEALRVMEQFPWPGNVRQLQHTIERIVALKPEGPVSAADLDHLLQASSGQKPDDKGTLPYTEEREHFERSYFEKLLENTGGNVSEAARLSRLSRQSLYMHMKRWGIVTNS
jgi:two-component system response regulator HydG